MSELKLFFASVTQNDTNMINPAFNEKLCHSLRSENLVRYLFETNIHPKLVGHADCFIEYLIQSHQFTEIDLKCIWSLFKVLLLLI